MSTYLTKAEYKELTEVPDPYFGGSEGFEKVRYPDLLARCGCMQQQVVTMPRTWLSLETSSLEGG